LLDNAEHRVFQVAQLKRAEEFIRLKELIWPTMERIKQLHTTQGALTGVASGFTDLDRLTAGFQRGDLIILAARPSMGKTALALNAEHDIGMVVVDYLQMMQGPTDSESRQQEISFISRSLKALAKELDVPVLALSQLSRAPEQRGGEHRRPQLSDLRESGAIEQD